MAEAKSDLGAVARGTRRVLIVQLIVALVLIGATAWAAWELPRILKQTAVAKAEYEQTIAERDEAQSEMQRFLEARPDFLDGVKALEENRIEDALTFLSRARSASEGQPPHQGAADAGILRYLARAQALAGQAAPALETMRALAGLRVAAEDHTPDQVDQAWLAAILCANNDSAAARAILADAVFVQTARGDPQFLPNVPLLAQACANLAPDELARLRAPMHMQGAETVSGAPMRADTPDAYRIRTIFIHYTRASDRDKAEAVRARLGAAGFNMAANQLIEGAPSNSVRFFYGVQRPQAESIRAQVQAILAEEQWGGNVEAMRLIPLEGRFQNLRRDRIEIWLPPGD